MFVRNLLLTFFAVGSLVAQIAPSTSLVGNILDPRGGAVPSATLELTNTSTHIKRLAASDSQGRYLFRALPPGQYELSANADGFAPFRQEGITLNVDVPATVNIRLGLATVTGQVTVQADASMVDTESGTLRQVVSERRAHFYGPGCGGGQGNRHGFIRHDVRHAGDLCERHVRQSGGL